MTTTSEGWLTREVRLNRDNQTERLTVGRRVQSGTSVLRIFERHFSEPFRTSFRRDCPNHESQIFRAPNSRRIGKMIKMQRKFSFMRRCSQLTSASPRARGIKAGPAKKSIFVVP